MKTQNLILLAVAIGAIWYFTKKKSETITPETPEQPQAPEKNTNTGSYTAQDTALPNVVLTPGLPGSSYGSGSKQQAEMVGIY